MSDNVSLSCTNSLVTIMVVINHRNIPRGPRCLQSPDVACGTLRVLLRNLRCPTCVRLFNITDPTFHPIISDRTCPNLPRTPLLAMNRVPQFSRRMHHVVRSMVPHRVVPQEKFKILKAIKYHSLLYQLLTTIGLNTCMTQTRITKPPFGIE